MGRPSKKLVRASLIHALLYQLKKLAVREDLSPGMTTPIQATIRGTVGSTAVEESIDGVLTVGHDSEAASSSGAPAEQVTAVLLDQLPEARRQLVLRSLPDKYRKEQRLPEVPKERLEEARQFLKQLRSTRTVTRRGTVRFAPAA